jgi:E3 ubiquitin-protein ligase TRAF7
MVSPATEEEFKEIIVLAETAKNETLICPLCKGVFRDPHIATCGHSFCRPCLQGKSDLCPLDHNTLSMVVKNLAIADQVGELLIHCRYGSKPREDSTEEYEVDPEGE